MASRVVSAFEHETLPIGLGRAANAITSTEAAVLAQLAEIRPGFCALGHQSIRTAQYVGLVSLGDRVLEILPKVDAGSATPEVGRGVFLRLLRLSSDLKLFADSQVHHDLRHQTLMDVFIAAFLDEVALLVRTGLLRRYESVEDDLSLIRGRLLIERQATRHAMRFHQLACRYDELTVDHLWNQALKAAMDVSRPWITRIDLGRRCMELSAVLADVTRHAVTPEDIDALVFDRQAARYRPALTWAKWILKALSPNLRAGRNQAPGLVFDMNKLFETSVLTVLRQRAAYQANTRIGSQDTGRFLTQLVNASGTPVFGVRPDIVVRHGASIVAVADTKWTRVGMRPDGHLLPDASHVYQMQAYASVYPCDEFTLIYPWHSGLEDAKPTSFRLPVVGARQPVLNVACLDVGSDALALRGGGMDGIITGLLSRA